MKTRFTKWFTALLLTAFMAGCGGGGGGGGTTPTPTAQTLSGTAARGAAIASVTVTVKDANGNTATGTTGTDGKYSIDVTGMTAPFLLKVTDGSDTLYGVATATGTANIHPFTDLIIRNWYKVQGTDVVTVFAGTGALPNPPTATAIDTIEAVVRELLTNLLLSAGINPDQFNLITTAFDANNLGFDNVLERTQVTDTGTTVTVTEVDPTTGTTGDTIISMPTDTNLTTSTDPVEQARSAINAKLAALKELINTKKCALASTDLEPEYFENGFLHQGHNSQLIADNIKYALGCSPTQTTPLYTITELSLVNVVSYDTSANLLTGGIVLRLSNGVSIGNILVFDLNTRVAMGDKEIAESGARSMMEKNIATPGTTVSYSLHVKVNDYLDQLQSVTITDNRGIVTDIPLFCDNTDIPTDNDCSPGETAQGMKRSFMAPIGTTMPTVGSIYTITLTKTDNSTISYQRTITATPGIYTTDIPEFSGLATHSLSAVLDTPITAQVYTPLWVSETGAPFVALWAGSQFYDDAVQAQWVGTPQPGQVNTFTVTIPSTYNGRQVTHAVLSQDAGNYPDLGWGVSFVRWHFE
jgi:hypothetical protein